MSTVSARCLNPEVLNQLRKMKGPKNCNGRPAAVAGVRRNLFGSPGPEARAFAEKEIAEATAQGCEKWNFNFKTERPFHGSHRYEWRSTIGSPMETESRPAAVIETRKRIFLGSPMTQTKITDYMPSRKRSAVGGSGPSAKNARLSGAPGPGAARRPEAAPAPVSQDRSG